MTMSPQVAQHLLEYAARVLYAAIGDASGPLRIQISAPGNPASIVLEPDRPLDAEEVPEFLSPEHKELLQFAAATYASSEAWKPLQALLDKGCSLQTAQLCELTGQKPSEVKHILADLVDRGALENDPRKGYRPVDRLMLELLRKWILMSAPECTSDP